MPSRDVLLSQQNTCNFQDMQLYLLRMLSRLLEMSHFRTSARCYVLSEYTSTRAFQYFIAGFMTCRLKLAREFGMNQNWTHTWSQRGEGLRPGCLQLQLLSQYEGRLKNKAYTVHYFGFNNLCSSTNSSHLSALVNHTELCLYFPFGPQWPVLG